MENFVTKILINKVRHLTQIEIELSTQKRKHLILTGVNGCGKTSLLESIKFHLNNELEYNDSDIELILSSKEDILNQYNQGKFIVGYYSDNRMFKALEAVHIEKVHLQERYTIVDSAGEWLLKYLLDLKTTQALAQTSSNVNIEKIDKIKAWFVRFENLLKNLFADETLALDFDIDNFQFYIKTKNREPFKFNQMSSGYSAVLNIVADLMLRMERNITTTYDLQGIVLIDELETHLHLDLQKRILPFLTELFPKIQFIITTNSPFILNSADNTIIYDLENSITIEDGLKNLPFSGVVEGYFNIDTLSVELKEKFDRYKQLSKNDMLDDEDYVELAELELYLDEIPDYLALEISSEYNRLKFEFESRV